MDCSQASSLYAKVEEVIGAPSSQEVVEERPTDIYSAIEAANDKYVASIQQDFSEDPPYSPPDSGFKPSQPVEAPSLGYGAPLADPLTVYTSPNQVTARQKRQRGPSRKGTRGKDQGSRGKGGRRNRNGKNWGGSSLAKSSGNRRPQGRGGRKTAKHSWIPGT